ncbi:multidrug ABC transporter ATP-binding protein [Vulcanibacillus modesticaldus]|uniref:Multidrug ABC transporter ATP-binding protein n=1 Tax=Vulcanibacillus modesticaldus TaxID=337097 RepID=A0A1D2YX62_9BACI|nr:ABC-F family ATP-binding cassette domain-containing protein [Vulcanibacillus modesticaldus]OEG00262.1 multidrug ABC transporter ATP-binding protein [Vulcanibacillus modesticaldus]
MIILQTQGVTKSFGIDVILTDIDMVIQSTDRIGLVGVNGAGKSTLLKIIAAKILPDSGEINIAKDTKIGYLAQDSGLETERSIWEEMRSVFIHLIEQEKYIRSLEDQMATLSYQENNKEYEKLMNEYSKVTEQFKDNGGYSYEAKIRSILHGLGFGDFDLHNQPIYTLSGGQKTRLAMAKLLLEEPNLLILDEPTNYLDVESLRWLEGYLKSYSGAILLVSHDRYFLDTLVNVIYEIEKTKATRYVGNYSQYIKQKAANIEIMLKKYDKQQIEIKKLEDFIQKNIARASTTRRAQSRRKMLEKMELIDRPTSNRTVSFAFETDFQSGNIVLTVKDLAMGFDDKSLFQNVSFMVKKQERIALIGPNGIGKSTLFKLIRKKFQPKHGTIEFGSKVKVGYYDQEQEDLHLEKRIIDEVWDDYPELTEKEIRTILGNFLFIGDDVFKKIKDLSGGEKARVSLAKLMLKRANFLLLDEPTNHLDIYSREVLENALIDYPGTILFISHDRYFLNRIATRIIELNATGIINYLGNYDYYLEKKAEQEEASDNSLSLEDKKRKEQLNKERERKKSQRQLRRKIESLEQEIDKIEKNVAEIESELLQPEVYLDHQLSYSKNEELNQLKSRLELLLVEWEETQIKLED